jgi:hypothetical protein
VKVQTFCYLWVHSLGGTASHAVEKFDPQNPFTTHSALRSVPTATVRTHLPGLFSSEPLKGYYYIATFMPLTVLEDLLATMKGTTKEWSPVVVTAVGGQGKPPAAGLQGHPQRVPGGPPLSIHCA